MKSIDINCDMGESFGEYTIGMDADVIQYISSANVACGWHAGDPLVMNRTVKMAVDANVAIGAHPGYPDLIGFGRRTMGCTPEQIRDYLIYQIGALQAFCSVHGTRVQHVKLHGALYLAAVADELVARAIAEAILSVDSVLLFVAMAGKKGESMRRISEEVGLKVVYEGFADRAYTAEGSLVPRKEKAAVIRDPQAVINQALRMARDAEVVAVDGTVVKLETHTLCVHGDNPAAVALVSGIRKGLEAESIAVAPMAHNTR